MVRIEWGYESPFIDREDDTNQTSIKSYIFQENEKRIPFTKRFRYSKKNRLDLIQEW